MKRNNLITPTNINMIVSEEEKKILEDYRSLEDREKKLVKVMLDFYTTGKNED